MKFIEVYLCSQHVMKYIFETHCKNVNQVFYTLYTQCTLYTNYKNTDFPYMYINSNIVTAEIFILDPKKKKKKK